MDRISALRNIEDALSDFEAGQIDLATMEKRVRATLRTYATDFDDLKTYQASGPSSVDGLVVVADSPREARNRIHDLVDGDIERFEVELAE
jgi:ABC-type phosphate/phosphonate transport system substrate-binding protein